VAFETEKELRSRGFPKTPDVLLSVPMGVVDSLGNVFVVRWIDSKAMYGDQATRNENIEQVQGYVNRFGPGMVIYWFGFHPSLSLPDVFVCDSFPTNLVVIGKA